MKQMSATLGNYRLRLNDEGRLRIDRRIDDGYWQRLDPTSDRLIYDELVATVGRAWVIAAHPV